MRTDLGRKQDTLTDPVEPADFQESKDLDFEDGGGADVLETGDDGESPSGGRRRSWLRWLLTGLGVAAVVATVVVLVAGSDNSAKPSATPTLSPGARIPFEFELTSVTATSYTGQQSPRSAQRAAELIRILLSRFYDAGFMDPNGWRQGPADDAWAVFARSVAGRAKTKERLALTLGPVKGLQSLELDRSKLFVKVLLDPSHRAISVVGAVSFDATGELENGNLLAVANDAEFLFRPIEGRWMIVGYPEAQTTLEERPAPSPTPVPGPTGSASASVPVSP